MYTHVSKYKNDKIKREKSKYKAKKERKHTISTALPSSWPLTAAEPYNFTTYILYMTAPFIQSHAHYS
jgi:hypothetical protein